MENYSTIKNLDVHAIWNGLQDGVVQVNISITIDGRPDTRVALLDITNELMDNCSVQGIRKIPSMATASVPKYVQQHSSEFSGDTLLTSDAQELHDTSQMQESNVYENDERQIEVMKDNYTWPIQYIHEHSCELLGDALDIQNAEAPIYLPLHTPCVGNYMARGDLNPSKQPHCLFPLVCSSLPPQIPNNDHSHVSPPQIHTDSEPSIGKSRSTSGGTVEIHPPPSPTLSSNASLRDATNTPDNSRYKSQSDSSTPRYSNKGIRGKGTPIKPPWRYPNHQDFTLTKKTVNVPCQPSRFSPPEKSNSQRSSFDVELGAQHSSTDELMSKSMGSPPGSLDNLGTGTPGRRLELKRQKYPVGRVRERKFKLKAKDHILNDRYYGSVPLFARSCLSSPSHSLGHVAQESNDVLQCMEDSGSHNLNPTESNLALGKTIRDLSRYMDQTSGHHFNRLPSPDIFPRVWLRREDSIQMPSLRNRIQEASVTTEPSWTNDDGKLYLVFARDVTAGIYQVELEASLKLSRPDSRGWRSFKICGLPNNEGRETTGGFEFIVKPNLDTLEVPEVQYNSSHLLDARTLRSKELIARFRLSEPLLLYLRTKEPIREIDNWNTAIKLYTVPTWSTIDGTQMKHHASLTFEVQDRDIWAEKVKFSIMVKYGPTKGRITTLKTDEDSISLANDKKPGLHASEVEISIIRNMQNLEDPLHLYFVLSYADREYVTIPMPILRPKLGTVVSESMMLLKASPPVFLDFLARGHCSTWKMTEHCNGEDTWMCLERVVISPLFPHGLKEDAMVTLRKLCPVHYDALEASDNPLLAEHLSNVVKQLDIKLEKVFGEELECRMSLEIQIGTSCRLLTVDDHDWTPWFFVIDGRIATEEHGEWRENEEGYKTLFKSSTMTTGQIIKIEMHWRELVFSDRFKGLGVDQNKIEYKIPRILGKVILSGTILCRIDEGTLVLNDGNEETSYQFLGLYNLDTTRLPKMDPGYDMTLSFFREVRPRSLPEPPGEGAVHSEKIRFLGGYPLSRRKVRFEDEESDSSGESCEVTTPFTDAEEEASSDVSSALDVNAPLTSVPRIRDSVDVHSSHAQRWADRSKNCWWLAYSCLNQIAGYLLLGYLFVLLIGIGSETMTDMGGDSHCFDPNNIISDLLPSPIASLRCYREPSQVDISYNSTSIGGSKQSGEEDLSIDEWDPMSDESTTSTKQSQPAPASTKIAYVDWIDRALGWKAI